MTSDPSDIGHACKLVFRMNVEDVLDGEQGTKKITTRRVDDTLGLSGGSRSLKCSDRVSNSDDESRRECTYVEDEQGVFRVHDFRRTIRRNLGRLLVPPLVPAFGHRYLVSSTLEHQNVFDFGALLQRSINNGLGRDCLSTSLALIGRDDDSAATVIGTVPQGFGGETGKDGRVDSTDSSTSKECSSGLPVI